MPQIAKIRSAITFNKTGRILECIAFTCIAFAIVLISLKFNYKFSMLIAALGFGCGLLILCFHDIQIGFYGMIIFGFLVGLIDRLFISGLSLITLVLTLPFLLFILVLVKCMLLRDRSWVKWHPIIFMYFVQTAYLIVQIFNPQMDSYAGWLSYFRGSVAYVFLFFVVLYIFKDIKNIRFFFKFILGAIFITALYGCLQQWIGFAPFEKRWLFADPRVLNLYSLPGGEIRKFSFMTDPANFGTLMASGGVGTLIMSFGPFKRIEKITLLIFSAIIFFGMSYSGTRTAYAMVPAGIALYILITIYNRRTKIFALITLISLLGILYVPIYGNVTLNRVRSAFQPPSNDASYNIRTIHRHFMHDYMYKHPFGGGLNTVAGPGLKYNPHHFLAGFPPDSFYFSIALQTGWVGLLLECIFFFIILFYCVHYFYKCRSQEIRIYYAVMAAMLFTLMLGAYAQFTISSMPQGFIFVPFLACIVKLHTFDTPKFSNENIQK